MPGDCGGPKVAQSRPAGQTPPLTPDIPRTFVAPNAAYDYEKREAMIPMRDGVKLFVCIYEPKNKDHKYPIMFDRTPYSVSPYGADNYKASLGPSEKFAKDGFIFVYQDVRGRNGSGRL